MFAGDGDIAAGRHSWKKRFAGLGLNELRELRQLREENGKLKTLVADLKVWTSTSYRKCYQKGSEACGTPGVGVECAAGVWS